MSAAVAPPPDSTSPLTRGDPASPVSPQVQGARTRPARFIPPIRPSWRFVVVFGVLACLGLLAQREYANDIARHVSGAMHAGVAAKVITFLAPSEAATHIDGTILSQGAPQVEVTAECLALRALTLLVAAILAWPASWLAKALGLFLGVATIYGCNLSRIVLLYFTYRYLPEHFQTIHVHIGPLFSLLPGMAVFVFWIAVVLPFLGQGRKARHVSGA